MEELNGFDFNLVDDSLNVLENSNENNYEKIANNLINSLKLLKIQEFYLESNFKDLSKKIVDKFMLPKQW